MWRDNMWRDNNHEKVTSGAKVGVEELKAASVGERKPSTPSH